MPSASPSLLRPLLSSGSGVPLFLALGFAAFFAVFHSRYLINWDAGQFALGTVNYSLADHTPHPPGYFLFVMIGKALLPFTHDINLSFSLLAGVATLLTALILYETAVRLTTRVSVGAVVALLYLLHPLTIFHGLVGLTYAFESLTVACAARLTLALWQTHSRKWFFLTAAIIPVLAGFRPSIIIGALPFVVAQILLIRRPALLAGGAAIGVGALHLWVIPFTDVVGGYPAAVNAIAGQVRSLSLPHSIGISSLALLGFSLAIISVSVLPFFFAYPRDARTLMRDARAQLLAVAIAWQIGVFFFIPFGEVGYGVGLHSLGVLLAAPLIARACADRWKGRVLIGFVFAALIAGSLIPPSWISEKKLRAVLPTTIAEHDAQVRDTLALVRSFKNDEALFIVLRGQYRDERGAVQLSRSENIRLLTYYLPDTALIDFPGVKNRYITAHEYVTREHASTVISFSGSVQELIILAEYLHLDDYPKGAGPVAERSGPHRYTARLTGVRSFRFQGFTFKRL